MLSFIQLSVQEFPALYAFLSFSTNLIEQQCTDLFSKSANFLLGLSLESNQSLLGDLIPQTGKSSNSKQEMVNYIKEKFRENPCPEKSITLFYYLNELNDRSLEQEVQTHLDRGGESLKKNQSLSCSEVFVLLKPHKELNLSNYDPAQEYLLRLIPVVKGSRKAE